jgi:elongation factor G
MLKRQDPTFRAKENTETGQMLIAGMGELHLEVVKHRLLRDFKLNVKVHKPRVSYRETIAKSVTVEGQCNRVVNGQQLFAKVKLEMQPSDDLLNVEVRSLLPPDKLLPEWKDAAVAELVSRGQGGGTIGSFPLSKLRVKLVDAEGAAENSNEIAFTIAAADAFEKGLIEGGPTLLEPIMKLSISTPDDYYGDFIGDLAQRRGRIVDSDNRGGMTFIEAEAPLAELFGYSNSMRSLSQGRAGASMEPLEYQPAPPEVAKTFQY